MSRKSTPKRTRPKPKAVLRLPDLDQAKSAVLNSLTSGDAQRGYSLSGHLMSGHAWSVQNRPCTKAVRDEIVLLCRLLRRQICFCAPASRTAFEYMSVVKQAVEHGGDRRTVSQQLAPVFHGSVGGQ